MIFKMLSETVNISRNIQSVVAGLSIAVKPPAIKKFEITLKWEEKTLHI